jgi:hypothetical protein
MASDAQRSQLATAVATAARDTALTLLRDAPTHVEVAIIGRDGSLLGRAGRLGDGVAK